VGSARNQFPTTCKFACNQRKNVNYSKWQISFLCYLRLTDVCSGSTNIDRARTVCHRTKQLLIMYNTFSDGQALSLIKHSAKPTHCLCCLSSNIFHDSHTIIPRCIDPLFISLWGFECDFQPSEHGRFCEWLMAILHSYSHCQKLLRHTLYASS
jgi:hypothetical protein